MDLADLRQPNPLLTHISLTKKLLAKA